MGEENQVSAIETLFFMAAGVIVILGLIAIVVTICKNNTKIDDNVTKAISTTIRSIFDSEIRELAKAYAEERRLVQWIEEIAEKGELDVSQLATTAKKRAYALAVKKAEDAVTLTETALDECRCHILEEQNKYFCCLEEGYSGSAQTVKSIIKEFTDYESYLEERVKEARANLASLTEFSSDK